MSLKDKDIDSFLDDESGTVRLQTDSDIDAFLDDAPTAPPSPMLGVARQAAGAALLPFNPANELQPIQPQGSNPLMMALDAAKQTLQNPLRISPTLSQPGQLAGEAVENRIGGLPGKAAGLAAQVALDPQTYALGPAGDAVNAAAKNVAGVAGKEAAVLAQSLSGVKEHAIRELFKNPAKVLTAQTEKQSGQLYGALKKAAGITDLEEKLIAKAGDRTPGVARTVAEQLQAKAAQAANLPVVSADYIKQATKPAAVFIGNQTFPGAAPMPLFNIIGNHPSRNSTVTLDRIKQEGLEIIGREARATGQEPAGVGLTLGELIAARRAASKVAQHAKGSEKYLYAKDAAEYTRQLQERAPQILEAIKEVARSKTRGEFLRLVPRQKSNTGHGDFFKAGTALLTMGATSPLSVGLGTLAARGAYSATAGALGNPVAKRVLPGGALAAIRDFLQNGQ